MMSEQSSSDTLHVVTENGEQCFMWRFNQLTYIAQDKHELPRILGLKFGPLARKLDLSYNTFTSFKNIDLFTNLSELILDNNHLEDEHLEFKQNLRLKTLSINKNKARNQLRDLRRLVHRIRDNFPNLEYLSLIGNPLHPNPAPTSDNEAILSSDSSLSDTSGSSKTLANKSQTHRTDEAHFIPDSLIGKQNSNVGFAQQKYRHFVIYHLPNLRFLDSSPISCSERDEAFKHCHWMARPTIDQQLNNESRQYNNYHQIGSSTNGDATNRDGLNSNRLSLNQQSFTSNGCSSHQQLQNYNKGAFMRLYYKYTGKNSEGNRFIRNHDL